MKKNFAFGVGKYYFNIRSGQQNITVNRLKKKEAVYSYLNYVNIGKNVEWLGKWDGKKFTDTAAPVEKAA